MKFDSGSLADTFKIASRLSKILKKGDVVGFYGELGAGKTTFIKGVAKNFGVKKEKVTSSSFIILRQHRGKLPIYHVDLYRLNSNQIPDEVYEYIDQKIGLVLIEWAQKIEIPCQYFKVSLDLTTLTRRKITITATSDTLKERLKRL